MGFMFEGVDGQAPENLACTLMRDLHVIEDRLATLEWQSTTFSQEETVHPMLNVSRETLVGDCKPLDGTCWDAAPS